MNYKELCDFTTIDIDRIELKGTKGGEKEYACEANPDIAILLNRITGILHNRGRKDEFKRVWTSFLGRWSNKAGQYSANLNKALQEVREYVKEILDGNPRFQIDFESKDIKEKDLDYNRIFPRYITYYKKDGANDEKDGTKSFKIWASDIQDFFENYSNNRKSVISAIKSLKENLEEKKAIKDDIKNTRRAIEILQDCLDRGIWIAAAALLSDIEKKKEDIVAVINKSYLPLARTYQVLDGIGEEDASLQKAIKDADIPFFSKELDAVDKYCKGKGVDLDSAISTLKAKKEKTDQEVEDLEILENLSQKLSACNAAYQLRYAKCVSASEVSRGSGIGKNIKEIAEYGNNTKYDPSEKKAVTRMANKEIKKKQSKIRLGVFISIVILLLVVAIFSAFKPSIKYAIGREIVAEVDGCEYTYRKFDDTGVEIVAAKMPEGISEYAVIPEIDGHKVVAISEGVFADYTDFESVYIGKDIVEIGNNAFAKKDNRITIYCEAQAKPDAWAKDWANDNIVFWGWTDSQQNIEITWGNLRFAIDKGKKQAAILGLSSEDKGDEVDEIEIPSNVTYEGEEYAVIRVADEAFKDAIYISKITLPASVTNIGFGAFKGCSSLTDIAIPFVGATVSGEKVSEKINTVNFGYIFGADGTAKNAEYVPATLESVTIYGGIIAANAFGGCSNLQNIILGNSVKSIAHGAFNREMSLNSLTLPFVGESYDKTAFIGYIFGATEYKDNNKVLPRSLQTVAVTDNCNIIDYAFYGCENIVTVNIASSGETNGGIGKSAFAECVGLKTVTIKSGKFIDDSAFANCTSLIKVTVPDEIESFGNDVLQGCANIEYNNSNGIKYLDGNREYYRVLIDATNVEKSVVVTNVNTRIIAQNGFNGCLIEEIIITEDVVMIGDSAFANCVNIRHLTIPDNVKKIGEGALNGCSNLLSLTLPFVGAEAGVTSTYAHQYPFGYIFGKSLYEGGVATKQYYSDSNMQSAVFGGGIKFTKSAIYYIPESLWDVTITSGNILEGAFYNCNNITNITIPNTIKDIGNYAFYNCSALKRMEIPDNVTDIGNFAFFGCSSLTNINIPDSVTNIGDWAFSDCTSLISIVIPDSVIGIGWYAFNNCTNLIKIFFENTQGWQVSTSSNFSSYTELSSNDLSDATIAATYLKDTYRNYYWRRIE